jgi:hypothetical protein
MPKETPHGQKSLAMAPRFGLFRKRNYLDSVVESWVPCPRFVGMCLDTEKTPHGQESLAMAPRFGLFRKRSYLVSVAESWVPCPRFVGMCLDTEKTPHGQKSLAMAPRFGLFRKRSYLRQQSDRSRLHDQRTSAISRFSRFRVSFIPFISYTYLAAARTWK